MKTRPLDERFNHVGIHALMGILVAAPCLGEESERADESWWSLQPLRDSITVPHLEEIPNSGWARNEIDHFILKKLVAKDLHPSPPASARALIRRLYVDLVGLPPTPEAVRAYEKNPSDTAYAELVDELLASPHYGERWARHWLDVVRFGESDGFERNRPRNHAWPYRDWAINAFNADMPYDEFAQKQIAGDLTHPGAEGSAAAGFLVAGVHNTVVGSSEEMKRLARQDELEEIAGAIGQTFLGLTINCARCHDHKYDPISTTEYYQFISTIDGVSHGNRDVLVEDRAKELAVLDQQIKKLQESLHSIDRATREAVLQWRKTQRPTGKPKTLPTALRTWTFDKNYTDASGSLQGAPSGTPRLEGGALYLDGKSFVKTGPLSKELRTKSLVATVVLSNLDQRGGGVVTIADTDAFDSLVFGEQEPRRWLAGSNNFKRTESFQAPEENLAHTKPVQLALTYAGDGTITGYRNGQVYGKPYQKELHSFKARESYLLFGLRHEPPGDNSFLSGQLLEVHLFDRVLSAAEVAALAGVETEYVSEEQLVAYLDPKEKEHRNALRKEIETAQEQRKKAADGQKRKIYTVDPRQPGVMRVHVRGSVKDYGAEVPPGGIHAVPGASPDFALAKNAPDRERRIKLADWISSPNNPLLSRVMVNRVWHYHFGRGFVPTPSDLGFNGGQPSHPGLLEWLSLQFREGGFRIKDLHRKILLSATYRQASRKRANAFEQDSDNRWLWRNSPRRVEAEVLRDSILSVAGKLDLKLGGPGFKDWEMKEEGTAFYFPIDKEDNAFNRRTIYRVNPRGDRSALLDNFDCPDPSAAAPTRSVTTTPLQALSLMNNAFLIRMAGHFAIRIEEEAGHDPDAQIRRAWELALCRAPDAEEVQLSRRLRNTQGLAALCRALWNSNEWVFIE